MIPHYQQLLDAAIRHLQQLKTEGIRFLPVSQSALSALSQAPLRRPQAPTITAANVDPVALRPPSQISGVNAKTSPPPEALVKVKATAPIPLAVADKQRLFAELRDLALACAKCSHLVAARKNVVFGVGDINAALMFIGEAPGADEDAEGEPFVGRAGQLLTRIIVAMGLTREQVYIANILKCRPDTPGQSSGNRKPTPEEMETCIPYLQRQIDLIQPKAIVALGGTAVEGLLGKTIGITRLRGQWQIYRDIPLMPTLHPSYLLRPENEGQKRNVWEDMLQVMQKLEMPITEKQQNYFLKT